MNTSFIVGLCDFLICVALGYLLLYITIVKSFNDLVQIYENDVKIKERNIEFYQKLYLLNLQKFYGC